MADRKKPNRFCDDPKAEVLMCSFCANRFGKSFACKAFPDGIPREILARGEHDTPFPGDHGYRFLKKKNNLIDSSSL